MGKYDGHTPEPWKISKAREPYTVVLMPESKTSEIDITPYASIGGFTARKKHEMQANALLIADAPKLLRERDEAVGEIREFCAHGCTDNDCAPDKRNADCGFGEYFKRIEEGG